MSKTITGKQYNTTAAILRMYTAGKFSYDDAVILLKARAQRSVEDINNLMPIFERERIRNDREKRIEGTTMSIEEMVDTFLLKPICTNNVKGTIYDLSIPHHHGPRG